MSLPSFETLPVYGIDFGSQKAGTTVICHLKQSEVISSRSEKGGNADQFILSFFEQSNCALIGIDAPLSLPGVYRGLPDFDDYQYRKADRELHAMSPMFLGGLTARAMRLSSQLRKMGHYLIEIYPAAILRHLCGEISKDDNSFELLSRIEALSGVPAPCEVIDGHERDAYLALISTLRYQRGTAKSFGDTIEGVIVV